MGFQVSVQQGQSFLLVIATGYATLSDIISAIDVVATASRENHNSHALLDLLAVEHGLTVADHRAIGVHAALAWQHLGRVASVVPESMRVGVSESTAITAGLNLRTFRTLNDAIVWLEGGD